MKFVEQEDDNPHLFSGILSPRPEDQVGLSGFPNKFKSVQLVNFSEATKVNINKDKKTYISDGQKLKNQKESIQGVIANVNTQINKVVQQVQVLDNKNVETSKPPVEEELSLSI